MMKTKPFDREHAEAFLKPCHPNHCPHKPWYEGQWVFKDEGLYPDVSFDWYKEAGLRAEHKILHWKPAMAFCESKDVPDPAKTPALPFPFDEGDLAAFMLGGYGSFVADFYGGLECGLDEGAFDEFDPEQKYARMAVRGAFDAYGKAIERVGQPDLELESRADESRKAYEKARKEAKLKHRVNEVLQPQAGDSHERRNELSVERERRMALVEADVSVLEAEMKRLQAESASAEQAWLMAMVAELLKPVTEGVESEAPSSTPPAPVAQPKGPDPTMLADPGQLIEAFGKFTGMDASWFDNLTDTPRLFAARKVTGMGGKHYTPPLFCPFEVMQWLIDGKRKKGRKVSPEKAWQLLQSNFEKVYNTRSAGDPR